MNPWREDIKIALRNIGGSGSLSEIYAEIKEIRKSLTTQWEATVRGTLEDNSSDSRKFKGSNDDFFSVEGLGSGVWGLRELIKPTSKAVDIDDDQKDAVPTHRALQETYRILRDTQLARKVKLLHRNSCQICGESMQLSNGERYSEAHHIKPLGRPHSGPDEIGNIIVLCPNHHVLLDYGALRIKHENLRGVSIHRIDIAYIEYHNNKIVNSYPFLYTPL